MPIINNMGSKPSLELSQIYTETEQCLFSGLTSEGMHPRIKYEAPKNFNKAKTSTKNYDCWSESSCSTIGSSCWRRLDEGVSNYPACCVGYVQSWFGGTLYSFGTGFLIQKNIVMTCAHHLYSKSKKVMAKQVHFYPARTRDQGRKLSAAQVYCPKQYGEAMDPKTAFMWDFGVIILEQNLHDAFGYLGLSFDQSDIGGNEPKVIYGYPKNQNIEMFKFQGECKLDDGIIRHNFKTDLGVDGSPVLYEKSHKSVVVGIHQGNYKDGRALKLRTEMIQHLKMWLNQKKGTLNLKSKWESQSLKKLGKMNWKKHYSVDISANNLQESSLKILIKFDWRNITHLNIAQNNLGREGFKELTKGYWPKLLYLDISSNQIENEDLLGFEETEWPSLQALSLKENRITDEGVKIQVKYDWELKKIDLSHNKIGKKGGIELLNSKWKYLEHLSLSNCNLESQGIYWLTKANLKRLKILDLSSNSIRDEGLQQLLDSNWTLLESLILDQNEIEDEGFKIVARMPWSHMKHIYAKNNSITSQSFLYLCKNNWKRIEAIDIRWNKIQAEEVALLKKVFKECFNNLRIFDL